MPELDQDLSYTLALHSPFLRGAHFMSDVTEVFGGWRRSIGDPGGFKLGTAKHAGTNDHKLDLFVNGLGYELKEWHAGLLTWQGVISEMTLTTYGQQYKRSLFNLANWVKVIYTSIGDNLLTNGSGETGAWTAYGGATVTQSATWRTHRSYSIRIQAAAGAQGAYIQQNVTISRLTAYPFRMDAKVISGTWLVVIIRSDTSAALGETEISSAGEVVIETSIQDSNDYSGTVHLRIETVFGAGEIYCDNAIFQRGPLEAVSNIYEDLVSQREYGVIQHIPLRAAMTSEAANAEALTYLRRHAWPILLSPENFESRFRLEPATDPETFELDIVVSGYYGLLNYQHCESVGTDDASEHVLALAGQSEFIALGNVQSNTTPYQVDNRAPLLVGDELVRIAKAGDVSGNDWSIGVWADRKLHYRLVERELVYRIRRGVLCDVLGNPVDPFMAQPGWAYNDDLPIASAFPGQTLKDDPHWVYIEELDVDAEAENPLSFRRRVEE